MLNDQDDYTKNRNYWKYLKTKLKKEGNELVSVTNQLKILAPDGKRRLTDIPWRCIGRFRGHGGENGAFPPTRDSCIHSLSMRKMG